MHRMRIASRSIGLIALALLLLVAATGVPARAQEPEGGAPGGKWAVGIHANFPFLGISFRYWLNEGTGIEFNLAPIPDCEFDYEPRIPPEPEPGEEPPPPPPVVEPPRCPNALELHLSARGLFKVSDNPRADFYVTGGPSVTLKFAQDKPLRVERSMLAVLGEIEISDWPIERVYPVIDYGFALNLQNLYDFRWIAGGIGFHFYF